MKLYLSSYRIPTPKDLSNLLNKDLSEISVALIPNAKDYYAERIRDMKVNDLVVYMESLGLKVDIIDLRQFNNPTTLKEKLTHYDLVWAMGGNTYMLRYEMKRSGFDKIIEELLESGMVYGGDSAGALVACASIAGVELADDPEFAEEVLSEGLGLISAVVLPHVDNPEFAKILPVFRDVHQDKKVIELKDSQAVVINGVNETIVDAP